MHVGSISNLSVLRYHFHSVAISTRLVSGLHGGCSFGRTLDIRFGTHVIMTSVSIRETVTHETVVQASTSQSLICVQFPGFLIRVSDCI